MKSENELKMATVNVPNKLKSALGWMELQECLPRLNHHFAATFLPARRGGSVFWIGDVNVLHPKQ
jgi:hypothetical protein